MGRKATGQGTVKRLMAGLPKKRGHRVLLGKAVSDRERSEPFHVSDRKSFLFFGSVPEISA
jgi:hypothetical protein